MSILKIGKYRRTIISALLAPLAVMLTSVGSFAGASSLEDEKPLHLENIEWRIEGDIVIITYNLIAPAEDAYHVEVMLLNEGDLSFKLVPRQVSGAVGEGRFAGSRRVIRWEYKKDIPQGLSGGDYYFEISIERVGGMSPWIYVAAGAAAVGGAAAFLLGGKKSEGQPFPGTLPDPPSRPQ